MADYASLKATELKDLLKERGLSLAGLTRKQQYVEALEAEDAKVKDGGENDEEMVDGGEQNDAEEEPMEASPADGDEEETNADAGDAGVPEQHESSEQPTSQTETNAVHAVETIQSPQTATPMDESSSGENKRKRRSPDPQLSPNSLNKRLKAADEDQSARVVLPEDVAEESVSNPLNDETDGRSDQQPEDDVMDTTADDNAATTSLHPVTRSIYIRDLIRPLHPNQLRGHIESIAAHPGAEPEQLDAFHLDSLRTHAFAVFSSTASASRARAQLHEAIWPDEPTRRPLWVDYVPDDEVLQWIADEDSKSTDRRDLKRWEVVYTITDGQTKATHQEASQASQKADHGRPTSNQATKETPNDRGSSPVREANADSPVQDMDRSPEMEEEQANATFNQLDQRFRFTTTKPKLYYLPVDKELAEKRVQELDEHTSRSWNRGKVHMSGPEAQLRRYTFDDGSVLVDGGPDFGTFGGGPPGSRGGRGGGGRGGYRGDYRGGGYRGDYRSDRGSGYRGRR